jgi:hypothetical protein
MGTDFASADLTADQLGEIVKKLGGRDGAMCFLRGDLVVLERVKRWREEGGIIYLTVTSDGASGEAWIKRLEEKGFHVGDYAKIVLRSKNFKPTSNITYEITILKGEFFDNEKNRTTKNIRKKANEMELTTPNAEVSCLIRENFTDMELRAMGLWYIVAMHKPVRVSGSYLALLAVDRLDADRRLITYNDYPGCEWNRVCGFAFVCLQAS